MRILVVEDEKKLAHALKRGLEQQSYAVDICYDGMSGLTMAENEPYDLIILDRMLPKLDGLTVLKTLRDQSKQVPVLFLTAKDKVLDRTEGLNAGADDYLVKPFAFIELLARVRALLRRPQTSIGEKLVYQDLELDPQNYQVVRQGKNIDLTNKEFALLEYFMRNPGRMLNKDQLSENVWDYDADILPNTVEVYVGYLRNKIDRPFDKAFINTKRGFGYYFGELGSVS